MPAKSKTESFSVTISGIAYETGMQSLFEVKPTSTRKRGFGYQVNYTGLTLAQVRELGEKMAVLACDLADLGEDSRMSQIYRDLDRFPEEAGVR